MFVVVYVIYGVISEVFHDQTMLFVIRVDYVSFSLRSIMTRRWFSSSTWTAACSPTFSCLLPNGIFRSRRGVSYCLRGLTWPLEVFRSLCGLRRHLRSLLWPIDVIHSSRGVWHHLRGLSWPDHNFCSSRGLRRVFRGLPVPNDIIRNLRELSLSWRTFVTRRCSSQST